MFKLKSKIDFLWNLLLKMKKAVLNGLAGKMQVCKADIGEWTDEFLPHITGIVHDFVKLGELGEVLSVATSSDVYLLRQSLFWMFTW